MSFSHGGTVAVRAAPDGRDGGGEDAGDAGDATARRPRTLIVLALLTFTALLFSYLGAYAVTDALVAADVLPRWPPGRDPRPRRLGYGFGTLMAAFLAAAAVARVVSRRQLRSIDAMAEGEL